ncbi:MAG: DMT family transporter [Geminicoccaceae bacterium]
MTAGHRLRGNAAALAGTLIWASAFPATQALLAHWSPLPLAAARLGLGCLTMLALAALLRQLPRWRTVPWRQVCLLGGCGSAGSVLCLITGQSLADPVTAAAIATSQPLVAAVMGYLAGRERLHAGQIAGVVLAVAGAMVVSPALQADGPGFRGGEPLLLLNVILWTWYSRGAGRHLAGLGDLAKGGLTMAVGAAVLVVLSLLVDLWHPLAVDVGAEALPWLLWMGTVAVGVSVPLWLTASRLLGVTVASLHVNLAPFYVILMGVALGGSVSLRQAAGAALIGVGAVVAQRRRKTA